MKLGVNAAATAILAASLVVSYAQTSGTTPQAKKHIAARREKTPPPPSVEEQINALRQEMQSQIDALKSSIAEKDAQLRQAQQTATEAQAKADKAEADAQAQQQASTENNAAVATLQSTVKDINTNTLGLVDTMQNLQTNTAKKAELSDLAFGKVKIGGLFYGDWAYYNQTGFGPQFLTQLNQEGPGNNGFNTFDITRAYLDFRYTPVNAITMRITPNIYRQVNGSAGATGNGNGAQIGASSNGNYGYRLKYAYLQFNHPFKGSSAFGQDQIRLGQTMQPITDWEEHLYGYRFVNLTPWNYLSLSSTYDGALADGPVFVHGKEYLDYQIGVFNNAVFHAIEQSEQKQVMGRLSYYPFGTQPKNGYTLTGFGLTVFNDYGYNSVTPDTKATADDRFEVLAHYQTRDERYLIAGLYDWGRNAFGAGNMFSGAGPTSTGTYATFNSLASALLAGRNTQQRGYAVFGHAPFGKSPLAIFGMVNGFQPNTKINGTNPLDFVRTIAGISYQYNNSLIFALDDQNLTYVHSQFNMTSAQIATFSSSLAAQYPSGIANVVPDSTNAIFINVQFSY